MTWRLAGRPLRRVLITRLRYLGDVVLSTVVADVLKRGDPDLELGFLCETAHAAVLAGHPALDRVLRLGVVRRGTDAVARRSVGSTAGRRDGGHGTLATIGRLRRERYDLAVDLFFNPRSAWLLRLAGIPQRICGNAGGRRWLYTQAVTRRSVADPDDVLPRSAPGTLGHHLCRLAPLVHGEDGRPFLEWLAAEETSGAWQPHIRRPPLGAAGRAALDHAGMDPEGDWLLLAPGATWQTKAWPRDHWRDLQETVRRGTGLATAVLVPPGDEGPWSGLPGALSPLPLPEALGVVGKARALVTVDGGVMHAAVAMGTPTVALFGPTDPAMWFPYPDRRDCRVLATRPACHPCHRHVCPPKEFICLPDLAPETVAVELTRMLEAGRGTA